MNNWLDQSATLKFWVFGVLAPFTAIIWVINLVVAIIN